MVSWNMKNFIPICVDILEASKAKNYALEKKLQRELEAKEKVLSVFPSWEGDVKISAECLSRVFSIIQTVTDPKEQKNLLITAAKNPLNGLSRTEANIFIAEILRSRGGAGAGAGGGGNATERDLVRDLLDKTAATAGAPASAVRSLPASPTAAAGGGGGVPNYATLTAMNSRYQKSFSELYEIIKSIRLSTLMRGLLEGIHQTALAKHLLTRFAAEAERLRQEGTTTAGGGAAGGGGGPLFYLPVQNIVKILETTTTLRLHMAQILTLISWADSFQSPGLGIDYRDFAYYAADVIAKMYDTNELQKRSNVLAAHLSGDAGAGVSSSIDTNTALRGATKETIESYLREEFQKVSSVEGRGGEGTGGWVSAQAFFEIIKSIPRLQLSDRETSAVVASSTVSPTTTSSSSMTATPAARSMGGGDTREGGGGVETATGMINWEAFLPWAYGSIRAVCMERMIGRRVALMGAQSTHEEDHIELMKLGDRLIDISIIRKIGGNYSIAFVSETTPKNPRRSSLLPVKKKSEMTATGGGGDWRSRSSNRELLIWFHESDAPRGL